MIYSFNILNYVNLFLPTFLRKNKMVYWLYSLLRPMRDNHAEFVTLVDSLKDDLKYNSDTAVLEYLLRKKLFSNQPKVTLYNINNSEPDLFIGRDDDFQYEVFLGRNDSDQMDIFVNRNGVQYQVYIDFYVEVSNSVLPLSSDTLARMVAYINKYKTLGRRFIIVDQSSNQLYPI